MYLRVQRGIYKDTSCYVLRRIALRAVGCKPLRTSRCFLLEGRPTPFRPPFWVIESPHGRGAPATTTLPDTRGERRSRAREGGDAAAKDVDERVQGRLWPQLILVDRWRRVVLMASARDDGRRAIVNPVSVIATGLAAAGAAFLTSRFGIAGTVLGTAVMAMLITAGASILEVYLETAAAKARTVPSSIRGAPGHADSSAADTTHRGSGGIFARLASLSAARRRSVLAGTFVAAVLSFLIAMAAVTGVELSVGKSLSCWLWDECPERSSGERPSSEVGTRPSILGGQRITGAAQGVDDTPQGEPTDHRPTPPGPSQSP